MPFYRFFFGGGFRVPLLKSTTEKNGYPYSNLSTGAGGSFHFLLGVPSISILSRDPNLFRKPSKTQGKQIQFLKRTMVEKNGESIPRFHCFFVAIFFGFWFLLLSFWLFSFLLVHSASFLFPFMSCFFLFGSSSFPVCSRFFLWPLRCLPLSFYLASPGRLLDGSGRFQALTSWWRPCEARGRRRRSKRERKGPKPGIDRSTCTAACVSWHTKCLA